jgi:hypothetical protein
MVHTMKINNAIVLLRDDNLVWSDDFNSIRYELADLLGSLQALSEAANALSGELTDEG